MSVSINIEANTGIHISAERGAGKALYFLVQQHDVLHHAYTIMSAAPLPGRNNAVASTRHAVGARSMLMVHARHDRLGHWYDVPLVATRRLGKNTARYEFAGVERDVSFGLVWPVS